jgi:putative MFS transporter
VFSFSVVGYVKRSLIDILEDASISKFHYVVLVLCSLIYALAAMNVMLIGVTLPSISQEWGLDQLTKGVLLSVGYVGMFIGALGFGALADKVGRRKILIVTVALSAVFTGLCSVAWDVTSMSLLRFLAGVGLGGVLPQPGVYISEYIPAKRRGRFIGLVETSWVYGALLAIAFPVAIITLLGWRLSYLVAFIPLILIPFIAAFLPESIRYLESRGLKDEAVKLLKRHGLLTRPVEIMEARVEKKYSMKESLQQLWSAGFRTSTAILWLTWAVLVYTYHGIFQWLPTIYVEVTMAKEVIGPLYWVLIITLLQVPGYYSATFLLDNLGRKTVLALYLAVAGVGSYMFSVSHGLQSILIWSGVVSFFNLGAWAALYTYTPELYPTRMRGTGFGSAASIGRLAGIAAPALTGYIWSGWGLSLAFVVFAAAHLVNAIAVGAFGVETKGRVLEEISA